MYSLCMYGLPLGANSCFTAFDSNRDSSCISCNNLRTDLTFLGGRASIGALPRNFWDKAGSSGTNQIDLTSDALTRRNTVSGGMRIGKTFLWRRTSKILDSCGPDIVRMALLSLTNRSRMPCSLVVGSIEAVSATSCSSAPYFFSRRLRKSLTHEGYSSSRDEICREFAGEPDNSASRYSCALTQCLDSSILSLTYRSFFSRKVLLYFH